MIQATLPEGTSTYIEARVRHDSFSTRDRSSREFEKSLDSLNGVLRNHDGLIDPYLSVVNNTQAGVPSPDLLTVRAIERRVIDERLKSKLISPEEHHEHAIELATGSGVLSRAFEFVDRHMDADAGRINDVDIRSFVKQPTVIGGKEVLFDALPRSLLEVLGSVAINNPEEFISHGDLIRYVSAITGLDDEKAITSAMQENVVKRLKRLGLGSVIEDKGTGKGKKRALRPDMYTIGGNFFPTAVPDMSQWVDIHAAEFTQMIMEWASTTGMSGGYIESKELAASLQDGLGIGVAQARTVMKSLVDNGLIQFMRHGAHWFFVSLDKEHLPSQEVLSSLPLRKDLGPERPKRTTAKRRSATMSQSSRPGLDSSSGTGQEPPMDQGSRIQEVNPPKPDVLKGTGRPGRLSRMADLPLMAAAYRRPRRKLTPNGGERSIIGSEPVQLEETPEKTPVLEHTEVEFNAPLSVLALTILRLRFTLTDEEIRNELIDKVAQEADLTAAYQEIARYLSPRN